MDLTTLITACALTVDPAVMHALVWQQSGGEPWAFTIAGQSEPQVLQSASEALAAARAIEPAHTAIRIGLTGLPATPRSVTAAMFAPCFNIASAARRLAQVAELCKASSRADGDPIHCAVAAWHGSWERPDNRFADAVRTSAASKDMPDFEMPAGAGVEAADNAFPQQPLTRATASSAALDDRQRARQSPLFPVTARPSDRAPNGIPARDQPAAGEPKSGAQIIRLTATQPHADSLFVPRSAPQSATGPE